MLAHAHACAHDPAETRREPCANHITIGRYLRSSSRRRRRRRCAKVQCESLKEAKKAHAFDKKFLGRSCRHGCNEIRPTFWFGLAVSEVVEMFGRANCGPCVELVWCVHARDSIPALSIGSTSRLSVVGPPLSPRSLVTCRKSRLSQWWSSLSQCATVACILSRLAKLGTWLRWRATPCLRLRRW